MMPTTKLPTLKSVIAKTASKALLLRLYSYWPPFFFAGVSIEQVAKDLRFVRVTLKERLWNRNYVGTHFGGLLYAMVDAPYMIMVMENIGPRYIVWDKAASIKFIKPGRGTVQAIFQIDDMILDEIRQQVDQSPKGKIDYALTVDVRDQTGDVVCSVEKVLYIRKK
jgi:acyl-coenzyme A thioesterase PaaI-like protein